MNTIYAYDFETTSIHGSLCDKNGVPTSVGVWLVTVKSENGDEHVFAGDNALNDFMVFVWEHPSSTFIAHNAKNFDAYFIFSWLIDNNFEHRDDPIHGQKNWDQQATVRRWAGDTRYFTIIKDGQLVNFFDSRLILDTSIANLGKAIGKTQKGHETPIVETGSTIEQTYHRCVHEINNPLWYLNPCTECSKTLWTWDEAMSYGLDDVRVLMEAIHHFHIPVLIENSIFTASKYAYEMLYTDAGLLTEDWYHGLIWTGHEEPNRLPLSRQPFRPFFHPAKRTWRSGGKTRVNEHDKGATNFWTSRYPKQSQFNNEKLSRDKDWSQKMRQQAERISAIGRECYKGGFTYVNPDYAGQNLGPMTILDITSMYPWIYSTIPIVDSGRIYQSMDGRHVRVPVENKEFATLKGWELLEWAANNLTLIHFAHLEVMAHDDWLQVTKARTDSREQDHLLPVDESDMRFNTDYMRDFNMPDVYMTNYGLKYLLDSAEIIDFTISSVVLMVENKELTEKFRRHCAYWIEEKNRADREGNGVLRYIAKLMLNSVYGKLGQYQKEMPTYTMTENGLVKDGDKKSGSLTALTPAAAMITEYGRTFIGYMAHKIGIKNFVYADTDSLHILGHWSAEELEALGVPVGRELGQFKIESYTARGKYIQAKTYGDAIYMIEGKECTDLSLIEQAEPQWVSTVAGYTEQIPEKIFMNHITVTNLVTVQVPGGVTLVPRDFTVGDATSHNVSYYTNKANGVGMATLREEAQIMREERALDDWLKSAPTLT